MNDFLVIHSPSASWRLSQLTDYHCLLFFAELLAQLCLWGRLEQHIFVRSLSEFEGGHDVLRVRGQRGNLRSLQFKVKRQTAVSLIQADEQAYTQLHMNPIHTNELTNL